MDATVRVPEGVERLAVVGSGERNLKMIREALGVNVAARNDLIRVSGEPGAVGVARNVLERLCEGAARSGGATVRSRQDVLGLIADESARMAADGATRANGPIAGIRDWDGRLEVYAAGRPVRPKTANQQAYIDCIRDHDLVIAIGPAGTGKTYLAVAAAVHMLKIGRVKRLVLARPAVEAGERLGFLPGDLQQKVNPYLRPLFDALGDMLDYQSLQRFIANDVVEIIPLAFMRGRTLNDAAIILDEAQNATISQMMMFLTRTGRRSKCIVNGDPSQVDLDDPSQSGLIDAVRRLHRIKGVETAALGPEDIVRHRLVQQIVEAYGSQAVEEAVHPARARSPRAVRSSEAQGPKEGQAAP